jgi:flagella basal body P-ring formation protein FlgA
LAREKSLTTVERLSRRCPAHLVGAVARENLLELRPLLQDALAALEDIERRRNLTEEELALRHAFRMLL